MSDRAPGREPTRYIELARLASAVQWCYIRYLDVPRAEKPDWIVWSWFIPFVNLYAPFANMVRLLKASCTLYSNEWEKEAVHRG
jgi:hypothetical protein